MSNDRYRFGGWKYSLRGTNKSRPDNFIPQEPGLFAYPTENDDHTDTPSPPTVEGYDTLDLIPSLTRATK
jgi:hypothetical protein